jgi:hypothetical protein
METSCQIPSPYEKPQTQYRRGFPDDYPLNLPTLFPDEPEKKTLYTREKPEVSFGDAMTRSSREGGVQEHGEDFPL